jgi:REP element-mobilizing transposase RayT
MEPLAYHITWTTYGTWLHGDVRGWVEKGDPGVKPPDPIREEQARERMAESAVVLTPDQRVIVEDTIRRHCQIRGWQLHAVNVRTNHVHVVVTGDRTADEMMNQFKAWCSRRLSDHAGLAQPVARKAGRRHWFTEHGSTKPIFDEAYLQNAAVYVLEGQ